MESTEEWRPVRGYEGLYDVSDRGRVRSLRFRNRGVDKLRPTPLLLSGNKCRGYFAVVLSRGGVSRPFRVHRLVLEAFVGPRPSPKHECAHLDGNPGNNALANLTWTTHAENHSHKARHGTAHVGEDHPAARLSAADVEAIRAAMRSGVRSPVLAKLYGVHRTTIQRAARGANWRHANAAALRAAFPGVE